MEDMKQTAVDFLVNILRDYDSRMIELFEEEIQEAKAMERQQITNDYESGIFEGRMFDRLLIEAQELATKTNALNDFMRTQKFVELDMQNKDLLYKQSRLMNEYLQVLGKRIELLGEKFSFPK